MVSRAIAGLATALVVAACSTTPERDEPEKPSAPTVSADGLPLPEVPEGSSGVVAAALDGRRIGCQGWGVADRRTGAAVGCDTVFDVMSMTKQFTAAAIVKLEMEGRLRTDDLLSRFVPEVPRDKREITLRHLLTHTAGLVGSLGGDYEPLSRAELVDGALASPLRSAPGVRYHYSNVGYSLLAVVVEEASGETFEHYLAEHLFDPAGMERTGYVLPDWDESRVAVEYDAAGLSQGRPTDHAWAEDGPYWNLRGNGGMLSTAEDMLSWHLALDGDEVLDDDAKAALFRPRVLEEPGGDTRYAYGWVVLDTPLGRVSWHNGGNSWSYGEIARVADHGASVFWVTNQRRSEADGWNLERDGGSLLTRSVLEMLIGR